MTVEKSKHDFEVPKRTDTGRMKSESVSCHFKAITYAMLRLGQCLDFKLRPTVNY